MMIAQLKLKQNRNLVICIARQGKLITGQCTYDIRIVDSRIHQLASRNNEELEVDKFVAGK